MADMFTNLYPKDLTWLDNDSNMYLCPLVATHQVLGTSSPHLSIGWGAFGPTLTKKMGVVTSLILSFITGKLGGNLPCLILSA